MTEDRVGTLGILDQAVQRNKNSIDEKYRDPFLMSFKEYARASARQAGLATDPILQITCLKKL